MATRSEAITLPTSSRKIRKLSIKYGPTSPPLLKLTFGKLLQQRAQHNAKDVALISHHQNEALTYEDLHRRSNDLAAALVGLGVVKGDRVAVMLGNRSEYVDVSSAKRHFRRRLLNMTADLLCLCKAWCIRHPYQLCLHASRACRCSEYHYTEDFAYMCKIRSI